MKKFLRRFVLIGLVLAISGVFFITSANFSSGFRAGVPVKISNKRVLFKTWEGELNVDGLTNSGQDAIPTTWAFSIPADAEDVRAKIDQALIQDRRVKLMLQREIRKTLLAGRHQVLRL